MTQAVTTQPASVYSMPACGICCFPVSRITNREDLPRTCCLVPYPMLGMKENECLKSVGCCGTIGWGSVATSAAVCAGAGAAAGKYGLVTYPTLGAIGGAACCGLIAGCCAAYKSGIITCSEIEGTFIEEEIIFPETEEPKTEESKTEEPKTEEPKTEEPKTEEPKTEEPKK